MPLLATALDRLRAAFVATATEPSQDGAPAMRVLLSGGGGTVFPAAAAKGDALATPTVSEIGALGQGFNGTTWDRMRTAPSAGGTAGGTGVGIAAPGLFRASGDYRPAATADAFADANAGAQFAATGLWVFNNSTFDRQRSNYEGTLLASAARTATTNSADQVNYNGRGVRVTFNMTSVPAVETVTLSIQEKDPISGTYTAILTGLAVVATGLAVYVVYPGSLVAANASASTPIPRTWRVAMTHSASGSFTYSVAFAVIV